MKKKIKKVICLGAALCFLTGCGGDAAEQNGTTGQVKPVSEENIGTYKLLETPELFYEVPEMLPGLSTPSGGYDVSEEKFSYVSGKVLPEEFYLLENNSGDVVYTGSFSDIKYHKDTQSYTATADFSDFAEVGEYVLKCDYLGYSYPFTIQERLQENALEEMVGVYPELLEKSKDLQGSVDGAILLLLSYEFYGQVYGAEEGKAPEVLSVIGDYVEEIFAEVESQESPLEYDPYMITALLAKYGHSYLTFDWNKGNDAIQLAKSLWKEAEKSGENASMYRVLAAAELYRVTGTYSYRKSVQEYFEVCVEDGQPFLGDYDMLAALTHFKTDYKVNRGLCTTLMEKILDRAEEVATCISLDNKLLGSNSKEEKLEEIMWNMVSVSVVEYVITNYEYGDLLENQYFYLQGRNPEAYDYVNEMIVNNPRWQAAYIVLLCEHLAHDHLK